jgi:hypothetical protein
MIKRALLVVAAFLITGQAVAQSVQQSGNVTRGHVAEWVASGIIQDGGTATSPNISSLGIYGYGGTPFCITDTTSPGAPSGNYGQLCAGINSSGAYFNTATYGSGSAIPFQFNINGATQFTVSSSGFTVPSLVLSGSGSGATTLSSANSSSTNYNVTFPVGSGYNLESVNTVPVVTGTPTSSTFLRGDGVWATPSGGGNVSGPGTSTDSYAPTWNGTSGTVLNTGVPVATSSTPNALVKTNSSGLIASNFIAGQFVGSWTNVATNTAMASNQGYIVTGLTNPVMTLPASPANGDVVCVVAARPSTTYGVLFTVAPNSGQAINDAAAASNSAYTTNTTLSVGGNGSVCMVYNTTNGDWIVAYGAAERSWNPNAVAGFVDPLYTAVTVLTRGSAANNINDLSGNGLGYTANGTTTSTGVTYQDGYSLTFDGSTNYITASSTSATYFTGDLTVEAWVYAQATSSIQYVFDSRTGATNTTGFALYINASGFPVVYTGSSALITSGTAVSASTWTHLAVVRQGNTTTLYVAGTPVGTSNSMATTLSDAAIYIGRNATSAANYFGAGSTGYMSGVRVTKAARYSAKFTPQVAMYATRAY